MRLNIMEPRAGDDNPCPQGNGTNIGTFQQFTLLCGQDLRGETINKTDADNFLTCVDLCSSFHPKCEGVAFSRRGCELKGNLRGNDATRDSRFQDAAMAKFPTASSNCASLGSSTTSGNTNFNLFCGNVVNGNDLQQSFAATFQDCLGQCTSLSGCGGVSFDASMNQGFKNCYMKGPPSSSSPAALSGIDTAIVNNAAAAEPVPSSSQSPVPTSNAPSSSSSAAPSTPATTFATTASPPPSTTTVSVSANPVTVTASATPVTTAASAAPATSTAVAATTSLAQSFSTIAGTPTAVFPETSVLTQTVLSVITSTGESATQVLTVPVTITPFGMETSSINPAAATEGAAVVGIPGSDAKAWIAAPVVGSIAAVTVIAAAFVMWGKRRTSRSDGGGGFLSRLPFMGSRSDLGSMRERSGSRGGLTLPFGNYWRLGGSKLVDEESSRGGNSGLPSRSGVVTRENTPQYEVKQGKMALRDSLNGLAQNRSTLDGIPGFLRE